MKSPLTGEDQQEADLNPEIEAMINRYGKSFTPALCPPDITRGPGGACFEISLINILLSDKYTYVEGKARRSTTGDWVGHAWLTDGVHAFDPTWMGVSIDRNTDDGQVEKAELSPHPGPYFGIPMPRRFVLGFHGATGGYCGVLWNRHLAPKQFDFMLKIREMEMAA